MITSALITSCRREFGDVAKSSQTARYGDGTSTLFNLGKFPIIESSYTIYYNTSAKVETTHYTLDLDSGDLLTTAAQASTINIKANFKHAQFRDRHWVEAINYGIEALNSRGFFRQVIRDKTVMALSANITEMAGPTKAVDVYELLASDDFTTSGTFKKLQTQWSYQQDANKVVLGSKPSRAGALATSYLRNLRTYEATSATIDSLDDWIPLIKKSAGAYYYRYLAGKVAQQGDAVTDEGHYRVKDLLALATTHEQDFERLAARKKPTRPAKDLQYMILGGGVG